MTERDKQRLNELEEKTSYLLARQDKQAAQMNQIIARLAYIEARQYRIMKELGLEADKLDSLEAAREDAKAINLAAVPNYRLN